MAKKPIPTPDELRQLLRYEPQTGQLFWRACFGRTHVGYFEDLTAAARAVQQARIAAGFSESHGA